MISTIVDAYSLVRSKLLLHDARYPTSKYLHSIVKAGSPKYGMGGVGPVNDSEGSELLIAALKRPDNRPLWVSVWGGPNVLA